MPSPVTIQSGSISYSPKVRNRLALPELTIDMDGVLCRPISWFNLVISRDVRRELDFVERLPRATPSFRRRLLDSRLAEVLRYRWRRPLPRILEGLVELAELRRLVLLSGRPHTSHRATEAWLIRNGIRDYFSELVLNDRGLPNESFKLIKVRERGNREHVDDDGRVAYFLAQDGTRTVYLISWLGNARLPYPPTVHRVRDLLEVAEQIRQGALQEK